MNYHLIKPLTVLIIVLFISGCKDDPQRHLKLGKWYAQKGLVEEAILEFKEVTRLYPDAYQNLRREDFQALSKAHYNLSLMYTKKGWWEFALDAAESSFQLRPSNDSHQLVDMIKRQISLNNSSGSS